MAHPNRIRRSRAKGWRLPENAICATRPGILGNPFLTAADFRHWIKTGFVNRLTLHPNYQDQSYAELSSRRSAVLVEARSARGKLIACFCRIDADCHADTIAELAEGKACELL